MVAVFYFLSQLKNHTCWQSVFFCISVFIVFSSVNLEFIAETIFWVRSYPDLDPVFCLLGWKVLSKSKPTPKCDHCLINMVFWCGKYVSRHFSDIISITGRTWWSLSWPGSPLCGFLVESFTWLYWDNLSNLSLDIIFGTNKFLNM
jgi:hypothetical protein